LTISSDSVPRWYLKGSLSDGSPWIVPIAADRFTIGRGTDNSLILDAPDISRRHAVVAVEGGTATIRDLDSRNGTFLNGAQISEFRPLTDGDILKVGRFEFTVARGGGEPESANTIVESSREAAEENDFAQRAGLTPREREVLYLLVRGDAVKEIARKLFISAGTAKNHVLKIYAKTGCHSRVELVNRVNESNF